MSDPDPRLVKWLNSFASASAMFAIAVGLLGLAGWKLHSIALLTWGALPVRLAPNAAVGLVLLGGAFWLLKKEESRSPSLSWTRAWMKKFAARTAAALVCLMGLAVLAEHFFGWDLGFDQLLIVVPLSQRIPGLRPGLIASSAACDFILLASALLLLDWKTRQDTWPAQYLSLGTAIVAIFGIFALFLAPGASGLTMAFPAAVAFFVLACGLLGSRATWAVGGLLVSQSAGAKLLRQAIPAALLVFALIAWSISKALLTAASFTWIEASLLAILCGALLGGFITWIAFIVDRSDTVNARLERRVEERTAALQAEIAERRLAEETLQESERRYRLLFSEMVVGFAVLEVIYDELGKPCDHRYLEVNPAFETHSGLARDKVVGKTIREVLPTLDPFWIETYGKVATSGESTHFENYVQPLEKWLEVTAFRTHPGHVGVTFADVTARKQEREAREQLAAIVDSSDDAIIGKMLDGTIANWNSGAEKVFGYSAAEAVGQPMRILLPPERANEESDILARIARGESVIHFETVRVRKDGKRIDVSVTISPIKDGRGAIVGASKIARDISDKKAAELEIQKLNNQLEERVSLRTADLATVNQELEAFSYSVSHDLRAPLRHVSGFSQLLVEEFGATLDPGARHYLDRIQAGTKQMGLLVDELLSLARVGRHALNLRTTNLNELVAEVVAMLEPESAGRQVGWTISDLPAVACDPVLVRQVFQNLLSNALKFTRPRAHAVIEISHRKENGQPVFIVRDNGIGFNMKYLDKLFGVFQRLHRAEDFEGTGIGLATVQRIVHKHGGRVWAEGNQDKGAAFYFTLGVGKRALSNGNGANAATVP